MGGTLETDSAPGRGTKAVLSLPLKPQQATGEDAESARKSEGLELISEELGIKKEDKSNHSMISIPDASLEPAARVRVLLADDHAMVRQGLRSVLEGYHDLQVIGEAQDGMEAVELAQVLKPDVIVMDVNMPRMDGVEASKRIKRELPGTVVIGLSMHDGGQHESAMRESGAAAYLTKDSAAERLIETILRCRAASLTGTRASLSPSSLSE